MPVEVMVASTEWTPKAQALYALTLVDLWQRSKLIDALTPQGIEAQLRGLQLLDDDGNVVPAAYTALYRQANA